MRNILIVIHSLGCGGAEKSLISLLGMLPQNKWNIDLLIASPQGMYMSQIPSHIHRITDQYAFENVMTPFAARRKKVCGLHDLIHQIRWILYDRIAPKRSGKNHTELRWQIWGRHIRGLNKEYDLAISYIDTTNYYVIDKVKAKKKVLWIHNEFEKFGYDYDFERPYYEKADRIVTISQDCVDSFLRIYPDLRDKIMVLENISSPKIIQDLAKENPEDPFFEFEGTKILSIGRLTAQKGLDYAIDAAKQLKESGVPFLWYVLGDGELRETLEEQIARHGLQDQFQLVGIKSNPYPYLKACDIFAQTSRYEGKSIALDEAKILCCPILVTNYATVGASITNGENGRIVEMNAPAIAEGLYQLATDPALRTGIRDCLAKEETGNEKEIEKYISLIEGMLAEN